MGSGFDDDAAASDDIRTLLGLLHKGTMGDIKKGINDIKGNLT